MSKDYDHDNECVLFKKNCKPEPNYKPIFICASCDRFYSVPKKWCGHWFRTWNCGYNCPGRTSVIVDEKVDRWGAKKDDKKKSLKK